MKRLFTRKIPEFERRFVAAHMARPPFHRLRLERFPRGVDSTHIDVALDSSLVDAVMALLKDILRHDVQGYFWQQSGAPPSTDVVDVFRRLYAENTRLVLRQAKARARPETAQLFQLAVMRLLLVVVDQQLDLLRQELEDARAQPARQYSGQSLELHDRIVILARNEQSIRFRALHEMMRIVMRQEDTNLRKTRKTVMGISWPVSRRMLSNPMLQLGGMGSNEDFFQFYPHVLRDDAHAATLGRSLFEVLSDWLPDELTLSSDQPSVGAVATTPGKKGLYGQAEIERRAALLIEPGELAQMFPHEFDNADAVLALLGGDQEPWPQAGPWKEEEFTRAQQARLRDWMDAIKDVGLLPRVRASGLLRQVYPTLGIRGGVEWVHDYLAGECGRKELERRLQTLPGVEDGSALVRLIDEKARAGRDRGRHADERMLARFASELLTHRFDLKLACWAYAGMNSLRLLHDERKISMSSANGLLQDFRRGAEAAEKTVIGHVVLKADVRGSTEITAQMRARNLNPAAYFSRNLYDPITRQLKAFGAQKVFVEGDAVILSLMEYEGQPRAHLAVARACGLACRILQVVEAKNAESRELGLPELGLGIGIAYSNEAPTYLYDEGHQIMISPAINRADRLSSCHSGLRQVLGNRHERRVVVAAPALEGSHNGKSGHDGLVRYNVNGIELEAAAFFQLGSELKLQHIRLPERGGDSADRYHVGRYLDLQGNSHWLVVRETPIPLWMGDRLLEGDRSGRVYYEVVTDEDIIASAKRRMRGMMRRH